MDIIFDLDGTLADLSHRIHLTRKPTKNYPEFFRQCINDKPIGDVIWMYHTLANIHTPYIVSGRSDECREATIEWLINKAQIDFNLHNLFMRKQGDYREDSIVKQEILDEHWPGDRKKDIFAVFDDRDRIVQMWRANGLRCYQVSPGNF